MQNENRPKDELRVFVLGKKCEQSNCSCHSHKDHIYKFMVPPNIPLHDE